jgi:N-sulfoglucosamine sulfohydrolase
MKRLKTALPPRLFPWLTAGALLWPAGQILAGEPKPGDIRPNILWIVVEDTNDWMGCYGDELARTPAIDRLAGEGVRFNRAYMTSGVCSPARSALITGMYQTAIGAHHHRSSRFNEDPTLWAPNYLGVKTITELFRQAGYFTFSSGSQKDDYNFVWDPDALYDRHHRPLGFNGAVDGFEGAGRPAEKPFFGQIQLLGDKHPRGEISQVTDRAAVDVPPYYPDHPVIREWMAHHYDTIHETDREVAEILRRLEEDDLLRNTVIFFFSDHGMTLPRHKQFLYEGGIRVPMLVAGPGVPKGEVRDDLVSGIDIGPTSLALAGIAVPPHMHGMDIFDETFHREYVIAARDRCGIAIDRIRSVTTERFKYLRNFMTDRPWMQPQYRDVFDYTQVMRQLYAEGKLNETQARFMSDERPAEEFYDLVVDPHETNNLVHDPKYAKELARHRMILAKWKVETPDVGQFPEHPNELRAILQRGGDRAVNPECDELR